MYKSLKIIVVAVFIIIAALATKAEIFSDSVPTDEESIKRAADNQVLPLDMNHLESKISLSAYIFYGI